MLLRLLTSVHSRARSDLEYFGLGFPLVAFGSKEGDVLRETSRELDAETPLWVSKSGISSGVLDSELAFLPLGCFFGLDLPSSTISDFVEGESLLELGPDPSSGDLGLGASSWKMRALALA